MTRVQPTSAVPTPASIFLPTSSAVNNMSATTGPAPTPLPVPSGETRERQEGAQQQEGQQRTGHEGLEDLAKTFLLPKLRLNILDLNHPGAARFLAATNASTILANSVQTVLRHLYQKPSASVPGTRSVTLFLENMGGVAYTKGSDLDEDHKEIHFSLGYINGIKSAPEGSKGDITGTYEIHGVLVHELVHCFQHNGRGTCPGGLIEGIADWVRLKANLGAPHWKRDSVPDRWDQGYEKTAYFLDWLEAKYGEGTVRSINDTLRVEKYEKTKFWEALVGSDIETLWHDYLQYVKKET